MQDQYVDVSLSGVSTAESEPVFQYDHGLVLRIRGVELSAVQQAHFATPKQKQTIGLQLVQDGDAIVADIPDSLLTVGLPISCYLYFEDADAGYTVKVITIPVTPRQEPGTVVVEAHDGSSVGRLADDLGNLIEEATQAVANAQSIADDAQAAAVSAQQA